MHIPSILIFWSVLFTCCHDAPLVKKTENAVLEKKLQDNTSENPYPSIKAIPLPEGFTRVEVAKNSFADWLRNCRLKKSKTVFKYDGEAKQNQSAQFAVLDISVGNKNLQQCADAVMRLRAEYLFAQQQYDKIFFRDNDGKTYAFSAPLTHAHLLMYLDQVFGMCGSASLAKQLHATTFSDIQIGDVLIRGGFPGHAVIVMDLAINAQGNKIYCLAQSYMPAQDIHLLLNPLKEAASAWYPVSGSGDILTPEYRFHYNELRSW